MNLENCENPLWIRCDGARAGQLTTGKLDFAVAKGETEIESQGIKASVGAGGLGQRKPFPFPSAPAGAAFMFVSWETVRSREPIHRIALRASFDPLACKLKRRTQMHQRMSTESNLFTFVI